MFIQSASISLEGDALVSRTVGALGNERRTEIPVAAIDGYCVDFTGQPPRVMMRCDAYLVVVWHEGTARKHERVPILKDDPRVAELLTELRRARPNASLLDMPPREAMKQLGLQSARPPRIPPAMLFVIMGLGVLLAVLNPTRQATGNRCGSLPVSCLQALDYLDDPANAPMAARELDRACRDGDLSACATLGPFLLDGAGVPPDEAGALDAVRRACTGGSAAGCNNLAVMYATGRGVALDEGRAAELYSRSCDLGDVRRGCYNLGSMLVNGLGVARDESRGADLLRRSCDAGESNGCLTLGALHFEGTGVPLDRARARVRFQSACNAGNQTACDNLRLPE